MWITPKNARSYEYCEKCDYTSHNKYNFKRHLTTAKHKMDNKKRHQKTQDDNAVVFECACGKKLKRTTANTSPNHRPNIHEHIAMGIIDLLIRLRVSRSSY